MKELYSEHSKEQLAFVALLKQKMDELYGIMRHAPRVFNECIQQKLSSEGDILNCRLDWSFQNDKSGDKLPLVIEAIEIGKLSIKRFDSSWDWIGFEDFLKEQAEEGETNDED